MIVLNNEFARLWAGRDPFKEADRLTGTVYRAVKTRRTLRYEHGGKGYFVKIHHGVGWREICKNLVQGKLPVLGARNEWIALNRLKELGVDTMTPAAFGVRGWNPARQRSFIITEELAEVVSLEDFCRNWPEQPPPFRLKQAIIVKLADISRRMHVGGVNHRDYYICHFLLDTSGSASVLDPRQLKLYLIDLHRAQCRRQVPRRWIIKDVAGLWFSAMDIGLTRRDLFRFMRVYDDRPLRQILSSCPRMKFWRCVDTVATKLYRKENAKT